MRRRRSDIFKSRLLHSTALIAAVAVTTSAQAQTANVLVSNVNVLNLLSPFLSLTGTAVGQQTLQANLQQSIAVNNGASLTQEGLAISDINLLGSATNSVTLNNNGTLITQNFGVAANLAGGLPVQTLTGTPAGVTVQQAIGGYGSQLGAIYETGVNSSTATTGPLAATVSLLTKAYSFTSTDLGVAKNYFANGAYTNPSTLPANYVAVAAVAPAGYTLPTANGFPNTTTSIYDTAYGGNYTSYGKNVYGDSRPGQVSSQINVFYTSAFSGITTNASFPSGHTTYAFTDSILLGMLTPQLYQSMLMRASEYGNSRIVLGVHYPLDIIASRSFVQYDLAQALSNPLYINNAAVTGSSSSSTGVVGTGINLPSLFTAAQSNLSSYLSTQCGSTVAICATSSTNVDPYAASSSNAQLYEARLTYGLPTLTFAQAPREAAPSGASDASILLATIYGGSTSAAKTLAPSGGLYGSLSTNTINQIIVNTETNALAAFYGTSLSYWARINLYAAAGYFGGVTGALTLASTDQVNTDVVVAGATTNVNGDVVPAGVLGGSGTINGNLTVASGGTLTPGAPGVVGTAMTVSGNLALQSGALYLVQVNSTGATSANVAGTASLGGAVQVASTDGTYRFNAPTTILTASSVTGSFGTLSTPVGTTGQLGYSATGVSLSLRSSLGQISGLNGNQRAVGTALDGALNAGGSSGALGAIFTGNVGQNLGQAAGQTATGAQQTTFNAMTQFVELMLDPTISGRGFAGPGGPVATPFAEEGDAQAYASTGRKRSGAEREAYGMVTKAPPLAAFDPRWSVWAAGFGGSQSTNGDTGAGTADTTSRIYGAAAGADYYFAPTTVVGFSLAGGATRYDLSGGLGDGKSDLFQAGAFIRHVEGPSYIAAALAYGWQDVTTNRTVTIAGVSQLQGRFNADAVTGRVEGGYRYAVPGDIGVTPYAAAQVTTFLLPSYAETASLGGGAFALNYASKDVTASRTELGLRGDKSFLINDAILVLRGRAAWAHDYNTDRSVSATFQSLPLASFTVNGAAQPHDLALTTASAELKWRNGFSLAATFEGEFSDISQSYAGKGVVRYTW